MGIMGGDKSVETQFFTYIDVTFTMSGTTDNGLSFGASIDLDESDGANQTAAQAAANNPAQGASNAFNAASQGGETIFISGDFGRITMGDTDGAFDWAMAEVPNGPGSISDAETGHAGFNGNSGLDGTYDGQILSYTYSVGAFGVALSAEVDDTVGAAGGDAVLGLGLKYAADLGGATLNLGLGYQTASTAAGVETNITGLSVDTTVSDIALGLNYSLRERSNAANDIEHIGIGAAYTMDAISFGVNYGRYENVGHVAGADNSGVGVSVGYALGGGASLLLGYGASENTVAGISTSSDAWSLGVKMSF